MCALQKEVPYHGRLYLTEAHACFYSSVLLKDTKVNSGCFVLLLVHTWPLTEMTVRSTSDLLVFSPRCSCRSSFHFVSFTR